MRRALLLTCLFTACIRPPDPGPPVVATLAGTEWTLESVGQQTPVAGRRVSIRFDEDSAGGFSGCNWYGGPWSSTGSDLRIAEIQSTAQACADPKLSAQEAELYARLRQVTRFEVVSDRLVLRDGGGAALLTFLKRTPLAMNPTDLLSTRWRLVAIGGASPLPGPPLTIAFDTGAMNGFAGCRDYTGTWTATGDVISFPSLAMASTECGSSAAVQRQEEVFTTDLSEAVHYRLADRRLEIETAPGRTLLFERVE